jgi:hypothetical protein
MYAKQIALDPAQPNIPLDPLWSMRYSAGTLTFTGIPSAMTSAVLVLVPFGAAVPFVLPIDMTTSTHSITIENGALSAVGQGVYYVYGFDSASRIYGLGYGTLNITDAPTLAAQTGVTPIGNQVAIYNQATNSYYLITAVINDDGDATVQLTPVEE